jgi:uncharacterized protein (TIGR00730 family)
MGTVAAAAIEAGGRVEGVIPEQLVALEVGEVAGVETTVVGSMHERKALLHGHSDAIVCLPGGFGTLDELFEAVTWTLLGLQVAGVGLLDVDGYWDDLVRFLDKAVAEGFVRPWHRANLLVDADPGALLDRLAAHVPERRSKLG